MPPRPPNAPNSLNEGRAWQGTPQSRGPPITVACGWPPTVESDEDHKQQTAGRCDTSTKATRRQGQGTGGVIVSGRLCETLPWPLDSAKVVWFLTSWPGEPLSLSLQPTQDFQVEGTKKQRINILQAYQNHLRGMFPGTNVLRQQGDPDPVLFFVVFVCLIVETPFCVGLLLPSHGERKD